jgi:hypothetical protein
MKFTEPFINNEKNGQLNNYFVLANSGWRSSFPYFTAGGNKQSVSLTLKDSASWC